jgi:hypothetical protein
VTEPIYRPTSDSNPSPTPGPAPVWQPDVVPPPPGPAFAVQAVKPRRNRLDLLLALAAVVAIGGVAFAAGRMTAPASSPFGGTARGTFGANGLAGQDTNRTGGAGAFGGANRLGAAAAIKGQVVAITADQLTLKLATGQTVQIALAPTTVFHQEATAASADVATGRTVLVQLAPRTPTPGQSPGAAFAPGQGGPGSSGAPAGASVGAATDVTIVAQ